MADKKICPLTYSAGKGAYDQEISDFDYCVNERCAWWIRLYDKDGTYIQGGCAICFVAAQAYPELATKRKKR